MTVEMDDEARAYGRARQRLRRQVVGLALSLAGMVLVARHYVVRHLEQQARTMAADERKARDSATIEIGAGRGDPAAGTVAKKP